MRSFIICWFLMLFYGFVSVKYVCYAASWNISKEGTQSWITLLSSRNNGLIFWTETYYDSSVPRQWGTIFGLWIQQEVDDEPAWSRLKYSSEPGSKYKCLRTITHLRVSWSTSPVWNYFNFTVFCCLPSSTLNLKLHGRTSILHNLISAHNCTEIAKLLLLSLVGHTG